MTLLTREDLVAALRELVVELKQEGDPVGLRIVGGGALALKYFDRDATQDVDAFHVRPGSDEVVLAAAARVATRLGLSPDWLNFNVTKTAAEPQFGRPIAWETIYEHDNILIQVASAEALLVMKLRASRPGRDTDDIRQLMALCGIGCVEEADDLFAEYYPGESLSERARRTVESILRAGLPPMPAEPSAIQL